MNEGLCTQAYSHGFLKSYQCVGDFNKCCVHWCMLPWHYHTCTFMETSIQASGASSPPAYLRLSFLSHTLSLLPHMQTLK